jgi:hypothetical protein
MNDPQKYSPDMNDDENTGNKVIIGVVVGVSVLLAAVLGVSLLTRTETTDSDMPPVESVATSAPAPVTSQVAIPQPERIDIELTMWNTEHGPEIGRLLAVLVAPPVRDVTLLRFRCKRMLELVSDLQSIPKPPNAGVAEAFDVWLLSVNDAVTFCLEGSLELPDNEALPVAGSTLGSTGVFWDIFFMKLAEQVDLTGAPPGVTPELP